MIQMIESLDKDIKSAIINIQTIFEKMESMIIMKDIEDTKKKKDQSQTSRHITYDI